MNKEELKELAATLNGIADGKAWECMWGEGFDNPCGRDVDYCLKMRIPIRLKPWSLPPPPDGMQWHRDDWTEDMLPEGWRPHLLGEVDNGDEEYLYRGEWIKAYGGYGSSEPTIALDDHRRTKAQPPQQLDLYAELKAAHAAGKKLQHRCPGESKWLYCSVTDTTQAPYCFVFEPECYRIKPEQQKVPLGPGDVPPGTVFRFHGHNDNHHYSPTLVAGPKDGVYFTDTTHFRRDWSYLMENATINRSIPITGKWNPEAWEPCCKLIDKP